MKGLVLEIIGNDYIILFERALDHLFVRNPHFHPPHTRTDTNCACVGKGATHQTKSKPQYESIEEKRKKNRRKEDVKKQRHGTTPITDTNYFFFEPS